jgi:outer membrane receptor protein involved in Fe transport
MHARTPLAVASLALAMLSYAGAFAQTPTVAPGPDSPGAGHDVEMNKAPQGDNQNQTPEQTHKEGKTKKKKPAASRGPTLTQLQEVVVEADRPLSAASSQVIRARDFALRPHSTTQEILNNVPGLLVVQHQGGGKAVQYFIRGFDADHGTDFALFTDGIPVNMVTHGHGQGYADLNYLIPETVKNLELYKGPYFVNLGDFSIAGALKINTKDQFDQNFALAEGGSFATQRYVLGASVPLGWAKTLLAAEAYFSNGPFVNPQDYSRYNVFGKLTVTSLPDQQLSVLGSVYTGDWHGSGQLPNRVVGSGPNQIGRFGSLDPTEGGDTDRENLSAIWNRQVSADEQWSGQIWGSHYSLQLFSDFTFFLNGGLRFYVPPGSHMVVDRCAGLGTDCPNVPDPAIPLSEFIPSDGIEQDDSRLLFGGFLQYNRFYSVGGGPWLGDLPMQSTLNLSTRGDSIHVQLWRQYRRTRFFAVNNVEVWEQSVSAFWGQQIFFTPWMRVEGGVRGDVFYFDVANRLPNEGPDPNFTKVPINGNDVKGLPSPKINLVLGPWFNTEYYANFGYGFHSNDARDVILTGSNGLAQGYGYELGARTRQFDRLDVASALWFVYLNSELVFNGDAGTFEPSGSTRRWGIDFETRYQFTNWLFADYDLTYADPRFTNGEAVPLAPTLVMNGGLTAEFANGFAAALRFRHLGPRPANEERTLTAEGWSLLDLLLRYRWRFLEASVALTNITNTAWREAQFAEFTCVNQGIGFDYGPPVNNTQPCPRSGTRPAENLVANGIDGVSFTPGNPIGVRAGLQVSF